jgi:hypothetical protein
VAPLSPNTVTGAYRSADVPSPSCEFWFDPQHRTPPDTTPQVWYPLEDSDDTPLSPDTAVGAVRSVDVPSPIWPYALSPQQRTAPPATWAQVWVNPAATRVTPDSPVAVTGIELEAVAP